MVTTEILNSPYLRDPDVQLMLRAKEGDEGAFTELVAAYQDRIVGIFCHLLRNQEAAEDLAQEVFLRIYRSRAKYEPKAKFSPGYFGLPIIWPATCEEIKGDGKKSISIHTIQVLWVSDQKSSY